MILSQQQINRNFLFYDKKQLHKVQKVKIQFQCMSNTGKSSPEQANYARKKLYRNLLKKKISSQLQNDLLTDYINPFSQQLTPWNQGASKLQASTNLLKRQAQSKNLLKNFTQTQTIQIPIESIIQRDTQNYSSLVQPFQLQQKNKSNLYACPRRKISSQQVIVSKNKKEQAKRLLFHKKSIIQNKKAKKIANLTIQWDQDIIYNPQKKYFEEQSLKRKILRQFAQTKNQNRHLNRHQNSRKQLKCDDKLFKLQFKNNRIHKKQVTIFQFKKNETSFQNKSKQIKEKQFSSQQDHQVFNQKQQKNGKIKVSNLSFQPLHSRAHSPQFLSCDQSKRTSSDKWRFRTSLKAKRNVSPQKNEAKNLSKTLIIDKNQQPRQQSKINNEHPLLNKIMIGINQKIHDRRAPLQLLTTTTPNFFKKTID